MSSEYCYTDFKRDQQLELLGGIDYLASLALRMPRHAGSIRAITDTIDGKLRLTANGSLPGTDFSVNLMDMGRRLPGIFFVVNAELPYRWDNEPARYVARYDFAARSFARGRRQMQPYSLTSIAEAYAVENKDGTTTIVPLAYPQPEKEGARFYASDDGENLELDAVPEFGVFNQSTLDKLTAITRSLGLHSMAPSGRAMGKVE